MHHSIVVYRTTTVLQIYLSSLANQLRLGPPAQPAKWWYLETTNSFFLFFFLPATTNTLILVVRPAGQAYSTGTHHCDIATQYTGLVYIGIILYLGVQTCIFVWLTKIYPHVLRLSNSPSEKRLHILYLTKTHDATGFGVVTEYLVNILV